MNDEQKIEVTKLVNDSLDDAEGVWKEVGDVVMAKAAMLENRSIQMSGSEPVPTNLPGHEFIEGGKPLVDEFIALVLDMRESSKHLRIAISNEKGVSQLKRIYYETAAILPACSKIIKYEQGSVTEYLGDGLLAFFKVEKEKSEESCYASRRAAVDCIKSMKEIINPILYSRYQLPPVRIGIGLAVSKAIITLTGQGNFLKPTAFGICVFNASKLSKGTDEIVADEALERKWPTSKNGKLRFTPRQLGGVNGYVMDVE